MLTTIKGRSSRLLQFVATMIVLFAPLQDVAASHPDGNSVNKNTPAKTAAFKPKNGRASSTITPSKVSSQASSSLKRIRQEYNDAVKMGIAYDWVHEKRIERKKKKKKKDSATTKASETPFSTYICLGPLTNNMRHWHFSFRGAGDVFGKGIYHGRIVLPKDYPMTPPRVQLWTASGRFQPGVDICLSASAYHPEAWTPKWTVFGLVNALRLHMLQSPSEIGGITRTREEMMEFAEKSQTWSLEWWSGGSLEVTVSHAKLLKDGILKLQDDDGDSELQQQVTDELQSLMNQANETTVDEGSQLPTSLPQGNSSAETATTIEGDTDPSDALADSNTAAKKPKKKNRQSGQSNVQAQLQRVEQRAVHKRKARNHFRLMRLTKSLTDPMWVAFIFVLILIWLKNKQ